MNEPRVRLSDPGDEKKLRTLHASLFKDNWDVPSDFEVFHDKLRQDPQARKALWGSLAKDNWDVPEDYSKFQDALFPVDAGSISRNFARNFVKGAAQVLPSGLQALGGFAERAETRVTGPTPATLSNSMSAIVDGASVLASVVQDAVESLAVQAAAGRLPIVNKERAKGVDTDLFYNAGNAVAKTLEQVFPTDERMTEGIINSTSLGQGFGQVVSVMTAAVATGGFGATLTGVAQMSGSEYAAAREAGASEEDAFNTLVLNGLLGATEALPVMGAINRAGSSGLKGAVDMAQRLGMASTAKRINQLTNNAGAQILANGFVGGIEELLQETVQTSLSNAIAAENYDEARQLLDGVVEAGANGGVVGFTMNLLLSGVAKARFRNPGKFNEQATTEQVLDEILERASVQQPAPNSEGQSPVIQIEYDPVAEIDELATQAVDELVPQGAEQASAIIEATPPAEQQIELLPNEVALQQEIAQQVEQEVELEQQSQQKLEQLLSGPDATTEADVDAEADTVQPEPAKEGGPAQTAGEANIQEFKVDESVRLVPTDQINLSEGDFQNRDQLTEAKVNSIANEYSPGRMTPVKVWRDSQGKIWLLAGHHRLEGFKRGNRTEIPAQFYEADTLEQAKEYAKELSNTDGGAETVLERTKLARERRDSGKYSKTELSAKLKDQEGKNANLIDDLSYLDPGSKIWQDMQAMANTSESTDKQAREKQAQWIGRATKVLGLSKLHQNQIYAWLEEKNSKGELVNMKQFKGLTDFTEFIGKKTFGIEPDQKLPLSKGDRQNTVTQAERTYRANVTQLEEKINTLRAEVNGPTPTYRIMLQERAARQDQKMAAGMQPDNGYLDGEVLLTPEKIVELVGKKQSELKKAQQELMHLMKNAPSFEQAAKEQVDIFSMFGSPEVAAQKNEDLGATPADIEVESNANQQQIESAERVLRSANDPNRSGQQPPADRGGADSPSDPSGTPAKPAAYGESNQIVDRAGYDQAVRDFNKEASNLSANPFLNPMMWAHATKIAVFHVEAGSRKFADFSAKLIEELGDQIKPVLGMLYKKVRAKFNNLEGFDSDELVDKMELDMATQDAYGAIIPDEQSLTNEATRLPDESVQDLLEEGLITPRDINAATDPVDQANRADDTVGDEATAELAAEQGRKVSMRQFYENNKAAIDQDQQARLEAAGNVVRVSKPDRLLFALAHDIVAQKGIEGAVGDFMDADNGMSDDARATLGQYLIGSIEAQMERDGSMPRSRVEQLQELQGDILEKLAMDASEAGRGLRAFRFLTNFSPSVWKFRYQKSMRQALKKVMDSGGKAEVDRIKAELKAVYEQVLADKDSQINELQEQMVFFEESLIRADENISRLIDSIEQRKAEVAQSAQQAQALSEQVLSLQAEIDSLKGSPNPAAQRDVDLLRKQLESKIEALNEQRKATREALKAAKDAEEQIEKLLNQPFAPKIKTKSSLGAGFNQSNKRGADSSKTGLWARYRAAIAKGVIGQLQQVQDAGDGNKPPVQLIAEAFLADIKGLIPKAKQESEASSPRRQAIMQIADIMRNPERHAEAMASVAEAITNDDSILPQDKKDALALLSAMDNQDVSLSLVRKAMREQLAPFDKGIKDLITREYGVDMNAKQRVVQALVAQGGLTPAEAAILARRVDKLLYEEILSQKKKRVTDFFKRIETKFGERGTAARRGNAQTKLLEEVLELQRLGGFGDVFGNKDYETLLGRYLELAPDPKVLERIGMMASRINTMPDSSDKDLETIRMMSYIAEQKGFSKTNILISFAYANILSGIETQVLNNVSNFMNLLLNGFALAAIQPNSKTTFKMLEGLSKGMRKGLSEAKKVMKTGYVTGSRLMKTDVGGDTLELLANSSNPFYKFLSNWKVVKRVMNAGDLIVFKAAEEMAFYAQAQRVINDLAKQGKLSPEQFETKWAELLGLEHRPAAVQQALDLGYKEGTREFERFISERLERLRDADLQQSSVAFGLQVTYNQRPEGVIGLAAQSVTRVIAGFEKAAAQNTGNARASFSVSALLMRSVVPFTTLVSNVLNETVNYVPVLGMARAALIKNRVASAKAAGEFDGFEQIYELTMAKAVMGTTIAALLYAASAAGEDDDEPAFRIHGKGPADYRKAYQLQESGWMPYSIQIGKTYYSMKESSLGLMLGLIGDYMDAHRYGTFDEKEASDRLAYALKRTVTLPLEFGFLSGAARFFETISRDNVPNAQKAVVGALSTGKQFLTPNLARSVRRYFDPKVYTKDSIAELLAGSVPAAIPLDKRRPVINRLGEPIRENYTMVERGVGRFVRTEKSDPVWAFVAQRKIFIPAPNPNQVTYIDPATDQSRLMSADQFYNYVLWSGRAIKAQMKLDLPILSTMSNEEAEKHIRSIVSKANAEAKERVQYSSRKRPKVSP